MAFFDKPFQDNGPEDTHLVAAKLLADVHHELDLQRAARKNETPVDRTMDLFYDPLVEDNRRLTSIANRLDKAAANGDADVIAAQRKVIEAELATDQKHLARKTTIDSVANDVAMVIPMLSSTEVVRGALNTVDHWMTKLTGPAHVEAAAKPVEIKAPGDYEQKINVDGTVRSYKVHVPPGYKPGTPMPSVVMLHGISEDADSFADLTRMNQKADKEGFITIYPQGNPILHNNTHLAWNVPNWGIFHPAREANDVKFVTDVIDSATKQLSIDPNRTYVAGFSNGGMLAQEVAARNSDKVAAVALVGAALSGKDKAPSSPVSVIDIHGTADKVVPYQSWDNSLGILKLQPVSYTGQYWKMADGIDVDAPGQLTTSGNVQIHDTVNSKTGVEVKQIRLEGGTHAWPGGNGTREVDKDLNATDEIWDFFSRHPKNQSYTRIPGNQRVVMA